MAELPLSSEQSNLGPMITFGNPKRGIEGTHFYLKPEAKKMPKYSKKNHPFYTKKDDPLSAKGLNDFFMFDGQTAEDIGVKSARLKMITHPGEEKNAQTALTPPTVLRANPELGEKIPLKNAWGVRLIDGNGQFVDIPIEDLTTEKPIPKPRKRNSRQNIQSNPDNKPARNTLHDISRGEYDTSPKKEKAGENQSGQPESEDVQSKTSPLSDTISSQEQHSDIPSPQTSYPTSQTIDTDREPQQNPSTPESDKVLTGKHDASSEAENDRKNQSGQSGYDINQSETSPPSAFQELQERVAHEKHHVISVIGEQGSKDRRAADLAATRMEKETTGGVRTWWKRFLHEYFTEHYREFYKKSLDAAATPFANKSIEMAEQIATQKFTQLNKVQKLGEWVKDKLGIQTKIQQWTIEELKTTQDNALQSVLQQEQESFSHEQDAFGRRFELEFDKQAESLVESGIVRTGMGEKVLDADHKTKTRIKEIIKTYCTSDDEQTANNTLKTDVDTLFADLKTSHPDLFKHADHMGSSITAVAQEMRQQLTTETDHQEGLSAIDQELEAMQVRLGLGAMGEATQLAKTDTMKVLDWVDRHGLTAFFGNEYVAGTAVSASLSLLLIPRSVASKTARVMGGMAGGGAFTGILSGLREYKTRKEEFVRIASQWESGIHATPDQTRRQWFESYNLHLRSVQSLVTGMQASAVDGGIYDDKGQLKSNISEEQIRTSLANLADAKARQHVGSREKDRYGLIEIGAIGEHETNRTLLNQTMSQVQRDMESYLTTHASDTHVQQILQDKTADAYIKLLTDTQIRIMTEGQNVATNMDASTSLSLGKLGNYNPEVDFVRERVNILGKKLFTREIKAAGVDNILKEFRKEAKWEAVKKGVTSATYGMGAGILVNQAGHFISGTPESGAIVNFLHKIQGVGSEVNRRLTDIGEATLTTADGHSLLLGTNLEIDPQGNLDFIKADGTTLQNIIPNVKDHVTVGANGIPHFDSEALGHLKNHELLFSFGHQEASSLSSEIVSESSSVEIPNAPAAITDIYGVQHNLSMNIPTGTHLIQTGDHELSLVNAQGESILTNIQYNDNGTITNLSEITDKLPSGYQVREVDPDIFKPMREAFSASNEYDITTNLREVHFLPANAQEVVPTDPTYNPKGIGSGGFTDWIHDRLTTASADTKTTYEHNNAIISGIKHMMRSYNIHYDPEGKNVGFDAIKGMGSLKRTLNFHDTASLNWLRAHEGIDVKAEIDYNTLPNNTVLKVPNAIFGDEQMTKLGTLMDHAIDKYEGQIQAGTPREVLNTLLSSTNEQERLDGILLKVGYFSQERDVPTKAELDILLQALNKPEAAGIPMTPADIMLHRYEIAFEPPSTIPTLTIEQEMPTFVPIIGKPREGLEAKETSSHIPKPISPYIGYPKYKYNDHESTSYSIPETQSSVSQPEISLINFIADEHLSPVASEGKSNAIAKAEEFMTLSDLETAEESGGLTKDQSLNLYRKMLSWMKSQNIIDLMQNDNLFKTSPYYPIVLEAAKKVEWENDITAPVIQRINILMRLLQQYNSEFNIVHHSNSDISQNNLFVLSAAFDRIKDTQY